MQKWRKETWFNTIRILNVPAHFYADQANRGLGVLDSVNMASQGPKLSICYQCAQLDLLGACKIHVILKFSHHLMFTVVL